MAVCLWLTNDIVLHFRSPQDGRTASTGCDGAAPGAPSRVDRRQRPTRRPGALIPCHTTTRASQTWRLPPSSAVSACHTLVSWQRNPTSLISVDENEVALSYSLFWLVWTYHTDFLETLVCEKPLIATNCGDISGLIWNPKVIKMFATAHHCSSSCSQV